MILLFEMRSEDFKNIDRIDVCYVVESESDLTDVVESESDLTSIVESE